MTTFTSTNDIPDEVRAFLSQAGKESARRVRARMYAEVDSRWPDLDSDIREEYAARMIHDFYADKGRVGGRGNRKPKARAAKA